MMTPEQIQEYLILKEQQAYHAEKEKQKTYRIAILAFFVTILICFGIYFVVPEISTGAEADNNSVAVAGSTVGGDINNGF